MQQKILQNVSSQMERLHILQSNAEEIIERFQYDRILEAHEIQELEADFAKLSIELQQMQAEAKQVASEYAESIKLIKKKAAPALEKIRTGREPVTEKVFVIRDDETGELGTYNSEGILLRTQLPRNGGARALRFNKIDEEKDGTND